MTRGMDPMDCREEDCDTRIVMAKQMPAGRWKPYEAQDRPPFSEPGCWVLVEGQAWQPLDLIEDWQVRRELTEAEARRLVSGYPFHRPHYHRPASERSVVKEMNPS